MLKRFAGRQIVWFMLSICMPVVLQAQAVPIKVKGDITEEENPLSAVAIQVVCNGKVATTALSDAKGEYAFHLPQGKDYYIVFTKEGYVAKRFAVSTRNIPKELESSEFSSITARVVLFKRVSGVDYSMLEQPMVKYYFNTVKKEFDYDLGYLNQMLANLESIEEAERLIKEQEQGTDAAYYSLIKLADKSFERKNYQKALSKYAEALAIKPKEMHPQTQITLLNRIIEDQDFLQKEQSERVVKEKADADRLAKEKANADAERIAKEKVEADKLKAELDAAKAREKAEEARVKAEEEKIALAKAAEDAVKLKAEQERIVKENAEAARKAKEKTTQDSLKAKLEANRIAKEKADAEAKAKAEVEAKAKELATRLKAEADVKIKALAEQEKQNKQNETAYKAAIAKGDELFKFKKYREAELHYQTALTIKGGDAFAKERLMECERLISSDANQKTNERQNLILSKYPEGVTEEIVSAEGVMIIKRILVKNKVAYIYEKKVFNWGGIACFRDGTPIPENVFEQDTQK